MVADTFRDIKINPEINNLRFVEKLNDLNEILKASYQNISRQNETEKIIFDEKLKEKTDKNESCNKSIHKNNKFHELMNMFKDSNHDEGKMNKISKKIETDNVSNCNLKSKQKILLHKGMSAIQSELNQLSKCNGTDQGSNENSLNACKRLRGCFIQPVNELDKKHKIKY